MVGWWAVIGVVLALVLFVPMASGDGGPRLFAAPREEPWRRVDGAPEGASASFGGVARPGEFFVFQLGVIADGPLDGLALEFSALRGAAGKIRARAIRCISLGGVDPEGERFEKRIAVAAGEVQVLWCGIDVPEDAAGGYRGRATLSAGGRKLGEYDLSIDIEGEPVDDHGESLGASLSRLRWLDSTVGSEPTVTQPFVPVEADGRSIRVLGRKLQIGHDGLPAQITSFFNSANTRVTETGTPLLAGPMAFVVESPNGPVAWRARPGAIDCGDTEATWRARLRSKPLAADITGRLDYTGSGTLTISLTSETPLDVNDIRLDIAWLEESATYLMGLGERGGLRPGQPVEWTWDVARHQDCFWMGEVNRGMLLRLKDENYTRPLCNIYYGFKPLRMPNSWGNEGRGGVRIGEADGGAVVATAYSGPRRIEAGETLCFEADLYLTPFRALDTEKQWSARFLHPHANHDAAHIERAVEQLDPDSGPNVLNIHQANAVAPFINYPYADLNLPGLKDIVSRSHELGCRTRVYYTTRELTQNLPELYALHSLGGEVIFPGPGREARTLIHPNGPHQWLIDNIGSDFLPAWVDHIQRPSAEWDLSVITQPDSRWNNFYLEGLRWMVDTINLDGIYVDDTALDARSLQRARRILDRAPGRLIDLHSWNHMNEWAGYANNLNIYMEILPYLDRLWLGEGFPARSASWDFWLVEMSGLPFGLMSEMLDGADPSRGLVFGETPRLAWSGDPRPLWEVMDAYGIRGSEFIPFYAEDAPVRSGREDVLATVYRNEGRSVVALGNWTDEVCEVAPAVDWVALGLDPERAALYAPEIAGVQVEALFGPGEPIPLGPGGGWILVLDETPREVTAPEDIDADLVESFRDGFTAPALSEGWRVRASDDGMAVEQRAGGLRMAGPAHRFGGVERDLPPGVRVVEIETERGTDGGLTWGCGVALVWPNGQAARINLRGPEDRFGTLGAEGVRLLGGPLGADANYGLRLVLSESSIHYQTRAGDTWRTVDIQSRAGREADPTLLRAGKLGGQGQWQDHGGEGAELGWCAIRGVSVRSLPGVE